MNEELEDLSAETYNFSLPVDDFEDVVDDLFDDWLFSLANLYGGF